MLKLFLIGFGCFLFGGLVGITTMALMVAARDADDRQPEPDYEDLGEGPCDRCKWLSFDHIGWLCSNEDAPYYEDYTPDGFSCPWFEKE